MKNKEKAICQKEIPRTHEFYRMFIESLWCFTADRRCTEQGVAITLIDEREVHLVPDDGRIAVAIVNRTGERRVLPDTFAEDDATRFFNVVFDNNS